MTKMLKMGTGRKYLKVIEAICDEASGNIIKVKKLFL